MTIGHCPVPDKLARCQSIRPVRVSVPAIRSGACPVGASATSLAASRSAPALLSTRAPERSLPRASNDRAGSSGKKPPRTPPWADLEHNLHLDPLPLNQARPGQNKAAMAGRLIWRGTATQHRPFAVRAPCRIRAVGRGHVRMACGAQKTKLWRLLCTGVTYVNGLGFRHGQARPRRWA